MCILLPAIPHSAGPDSSLRSPRLYYESEVPPFAILTIG